MNCSLQLAIMSLILGESQTGKYKAVFEEISGVHTQKN